MSTGLKKEVDQILRQLKRNGCTVTVTGGGHWRVHRDGCQSLTMSRSLSDIRALHRIKSDVRRYFGIEL